MNTLPRGATFKGHQTRKRFGQNFLVDEQIIERMIQHINPQGSDHIVEIGPGLGALTSHLFHANNDMTAIELDRDLCRRLQKMLPDMKLIEADALSVDFSSLAPTASEEKLRIIGNLPYNISTPLLFHLLAFKNIIQDMFFLLQKEVAERLSALPGNKTYGKLGVMAQTNCRISLLFSVPPESFRPKPNVQSMFVKLTPALPKKILENEMLFEEIVGKAFQQRRKTLRNALKCFLIPEDNKLLEPLLCKRAENLTIDDFIFLSNHIARQNPVTLD